MSPAGARKKRATTPSVSRVRRTDTVNLRLPKATREIIDAAAAMLGKTRTEFVVDTARKQAIDVVLDQRLFILNEAEHDAFMRVLDEPPPPNQALRKLMSSKPPWEK